MDYTIGRPVTRNSTPDQPTAFLHLRMLHERMTYRISELSSNGNTGTILVGQIALNLSGKHTACKAMGGVTATRADGSGR